MHRSTVVTLALVCVGLLLVAATVAVQRRATVRRDEAIAAALEAARRAETAGDAEGAVAQYRSYAHVAGTKGDPEVLSHYARLLLSRAAAPMARRAEVDEGVALAEASIRRRPDDAELRRSLAEVKLARKRYAEAREHFLILREAVPGGPDADRIDVQIARTLIGMGDPDKAAAIVSDLTGFDRGKKSFGNPETRAPAGAYLVLESLLRSRFEDVASADVVLERCVALHPDDPATLVALADARLAEPNTEEALRAATRALELAPTDPAVLLVNGKALTASRDLAAAGALFASARRQLPEDPSLFAAAARHFMRHGTFDEVLDTLDSALERFPNLPVTITYLATMPIGGGRFADFNTRLKAARERFGEAHPVVVMFQARILMTSRQWYEAAKALVRARSIVPAGSKGKVDELLAKCHRMLGEHDEALGDYQRLAKEQGQWSTVAGGLARSHLDLGQRSEAAAAARSLEKRWLDGGNAGGNLAETLSVLIAVIRAQPPQERDWSGVERLVERLQSSPQIPASRKAMIGAEWLAAKGDPAAALESIRDVVEGASGHHLDPLWLTLIARVRGSDATWSEFDRFDAPRRQASATVIALARAQAALARGDDRSWFERILGITEELSPIDAVQVLHAMAGIATASGWIEEGATCRKKAAERLPGDIRAPLGDAILAARTGHAEEARMAAERVVALDGPDTPRAKVASAAALIAAAKSGEPGQEIAPSMPLRLGADLAERLREARKLLVEAANDRPRWHVVPALEAEVERLAGNWPEAIVLLGGALGGGDDDAWLSSLLVEALERSHRVVEADGIRLGFAPAGVTGADRAAVDGWLASGDVVEAVDRTLLAVDVDTADADTLLWLGRTMAKAGRDEEAGRVLLRATRVAPSSPEPWLWLARWHVERGDTDAAETTLAAASDALEDDRRALFVARGAAVVGRDDDAERGFREASRSAGGSVAPIGHAIDFLLSRGRTKDAKALLKETIADAGTGHDERIYWAKKRLADLERGDGTRVDPNR